MANIREQGRLILNHPYFADCLEKATNGDFSGFERLFYEIQSHTWEVCSLSSSRCYGNWHRGNSCDIKRELRNLPPPTTLDLRLPIPPPKEKIQIIIPITKHKARLRWEDPNQLLIPFPESKIFQLRIA